MAWGFKTLFTFFPFFFFFSFFFNVPSWHRAGQMGMDWTVIEDFLRWA